MKKILVIGGTGTMGSCLCPILAKMGFEVDAIASEIKNDDEGIRYFLANALDNTVLQSFLKNNYDAVVDFMWYGAELYKSRYSMLLKYTDHYFCLSSYRVYAQSNKPLTENSPRLLESLPPMTSGCMRQDMLRQNALWKTCFYNPSAITGQYCVRQ